MWRPRRLTRSSRRRRRWGDHGDGLDGPEADGRDRAAARRASDGASVRRAATVVARAVAVHAVATEGEGKRLKRARDAGRSLAGVVGALLLVGSAALALSLGSDVGVASPLGQSPRNPPRYPTSYFTGPLGSRNILPSTRGAFLFIFPSGYGDSIRIQRARVLKRERFLGRRFDGIQVHYGGGGTYRGISDCIAPDRVAQRPERWIHDHGAVPLSPGRPTALSPMSMPGSRISASETLPTTSSATASR